MATTTRKTNELAPLRAPLIAGGGTALLFAAGVGLIALFGDPAGRPPLARGELGALPQPELRAGIEHAPEDAHAQPVRFAGEDTTGHDDGHEDEVSLAGVNDGFDPPQPSHGSDPADAEARNAAVANPYALTPAPISGLTEDGPSGPLPVIGPDGQRPDSAYARPFHADPEAPIIAVIIGGMGLNRAVTEEAIDTLPPEVSLSFAPYSRDLQTWVDRARAAGHEVLIEMPMEPYDYPNNDPGPHTLLADASETENARRLAWVMSQTTGYFAVMNYLGARFSTAGSPFESTLRRIEDRGVAFIHDGNGRRAAIETAGHNAGARFTIADRILDEDPSPRSIDDRLLTLEALALQNGASLGAGFAYPATVEQVADWARSLETRGYVLAPASAVLARRNGQDGGEAATHTADAGGQH